MKHLSYAIVMLVLLTALPSCTDETIGGSITNSQLAVIEDSSFVLTAHATANDRILTRTATQLIGVLHSDGFGTLSSQVVTQFMPALTLDTIGTDVSSIDSCRLKLRLTETGFTGDSLVPMRLSVYRLSKALSAPMYSDFDPTGYYDPATPLGTAAYSPQSATTVYQATTGNAYREVYVKMPVDLAREIYTLYKADPSVFASPSRFAQKFHGMFITNTYGSGRMMNFNNIELEVFYRRTYTGFSGTDSVANKNVIYMSATPEVLSDNIITLKADDGVRQRVADGQAIVMAPLGYDVQLTFPIREVIERYRSATAGNLGVVNALTLTLPVDTVANDYHIQPPAYLLMVKQNMKEQFIIGDSLTNSKDSFYATYDKSKKQYVFSGMRDYLNDILDNKGGEPDADDCVFTITPVDVTTYTNTSTTSGSTTVVTKIAPQVSTPALARLRPDKAKVKITFSRHGLR